MAHFMVLIIESNPLDIPVIKCFLSEEENCSLIVLDIYIFTEKQMPELVEKAHLFIQRFSTFSITE